MQDSSQVCISKGISEDEILDYRSQSKTQLLMPKQNHGSLGLRQQNQ